MQKKDFIDMIFDLNLNYDSIQSEELFSLVDKSNDYQISLKGKFLIKNSKIYLVTQLRR